VEQGVDIHDAPRPGDAEEPGGLKDVVLAMRLAGAHVLPLQHVLVDGYVAIPRRRAQQQLTREADHVLGHLPCSGLHLRNHHRGLRQL